MSQIDPVDLEKEILPIQEFLKTHTAYELLPESGKVIVIDHNLTIAHAFKALGENGITSAPLFDSVRLEYSGMLTVTDFIDILIDLHNHQSKEGFMQQISRRKIKEWRKQKMQASLPTSSPVMQSSSSTSDLLTTASASALAGFNQNEATARANNGNVVGDKITTIKTNKNETTLAVPSELGIAKPKFIVCHLDASLYDSARLLLSHHIHRGPVFDPSTNTVLHIITHARILRFLVSNWHTSIRLFDRTIGELNIGTHGNVYSVHPNQSVIETITMLRRYHISAVPIVDANNVVVGVYSMSDVRYLAQGDLYGTLVGSVENALNIRFKQKNSSKTATVAGTSAFPLIDPTVTDSTATPSGKTSLFPTLHSAVRPTALTPNTDASQTSSFSSPFTNTTSNALAVAETDTARPSLSLVGAVHHSPVLSGTPLFTFPATSPSPSTVPNQVHCCTRNDTLKYVLGQLAKHNIHRLVVVDKQNKLEGVVSVNDILMLFVSPSS